MELIEAPGGSLATHPGIAARAGTVRSLATPAVRCWLQAQLRACDAGRELSDDALRRPMRAFCREARRRGVKIEQVIVLLKHEWAVLASEQATRGCADLRASVDVVAADAACRGARLDWKVHARAAALGTMVQLLIEEYYR